jgi:hypothetical protein
VITSGSGLWASGGGSLPLMPTVTGPSASSPSAGGEGARGFQRSLAGLPAGLGSALALWSGRPPSVLPEEHFEQIADPPLLRLLREGMTQR